MKSYALYKAITDQDVDEVKRLLASEERAIIVDDWKDSEDCPPLTECVCSGFGGDEKNDVNNNDILLLLLAHGADVNAPSRSRALWSGETAVMSAAERGFIRCLRTLVDAGADLNITSDEGYTALMLAAKEGHDKCVKFLLEQKPVATLNLRNNEGKSALMLAASCLGVGDFYTLCVQYLVEAGADLEAKDAEGFTALMIAFESRSVQISTFLLKQGALVNTVSRSGQTPFSLVHRSKDLMKLAKCGLDPALSHKDRFCLHNTVSKEHDASTRTLVKAGMPPLDLDCQHFHEHRMSRGPLSRLFNLCPSIPMSPLAVAILYCNAKAAKYFIANRFYTQLDLMRLPWEPNVRRVVLEAGNYTFTYTSARQCLEILDFLAHEPQSLYTLSLTAASLALSQDLSRNPGSLAADGNSYLCKPTFREKINSLPIYPALKRALLRQTSAAGTCCHSWKEIPMGVDVEFPDCQCSYCSIRDI